MRHEQTPLASSEGFGGISSCSCGQYHVHLPGVSVHLNEKGFDRLVQMILQAKENQDLYRLKDVESKKDHLHIVKKYKEKEMDYSEGDLQSLHPA